MRLGLIILASLALAGCAKGPFSPEAKPLPVAEPAAEAPQDNTIRPQSRPSEVSAAPAPAKTARTAEQFDTTTTAERQDAAAVPSGGGERALGETIASLGDVSKPGFWMETPLVSEPTKGRVLFPGSGKSAQVELLPIDGPATAGSRISLAAMRLIEAPLTDLPTLTVFAGG